MAASVSPDACPDEAEAKPKRTSRKRTTKADTAEAVADEASSDEAEAKPKRTSRKRTTKAAEEA
jgi:hypothetical protein